MQADIEFEGNEILEKGSFVNVVGVQYLDNSMQLDIIRANSSKIGTIDTEAVVLERSVGTTAVGKMSRKSE